MKTKPKTTIMVDIDTRVHEALKARTEELKTKVTPFVSAMTHLGTVLDRRVAGFLAVTSPDDPIYQKAVRVINEAFLKAWSNLGDS